MRSFKLAVSVFIFAFGLFAQTATAASFIVTRSDDRNAACNSNVDCSLREAINAANGAAGSDTITFNGVTNIQLAAVLPSITTTIIINGGSGVTVNGNAASSTFRAFLIPSGGNLTMSNITVTNAKEVLGGGLYNQMGGTVSLTNCSFTFNRATVTAGGGIFNDGSMTATNVTVSFNSANSEGDGIRNGANGNLTLTNSTVSFNGDPNTPSGTGGGGIDNAGTLNVKGSTIYGNLTAGNGGGIFNLAGTINLTNSTVSFNSASGNNGGGIYNDNNGTMTIVNCTVTDTNQAATGGGILNNTGTINLRNTIVAGNNGTTAAPDVSGNFNQPQFNLIGKKDGSVGFTNGVNGNRVGTIAAPLDPKLNAIANNGGATQTYSLMSNSPAANAGSNALAVDPVTMTALTTDQRGTGFPRIVSGTVDIGSFESSIVTAAAVTIGGRVMTATGRGIFGARVVMIDSNGATRYAMTNPFGFYHFADAAAGATYILSVSDKRYVFAPQVVSLTEDENNVNFVALN